MRRLLYLSILLLGCNSATQPKEIKKENILIVNLNCEGTRANLYWDHKITKTNKSAQFVLPDSVKTVDWALYYNYIQVDYGFLIIEQDTTILNCDCPSWWDCFRYGVCD